MNVDINDIIRIVKEASAIMLNGTFNIAQKEGYSNIVTDCDIEVQKFLCAELEKICPDCGFLCEEEDMQNPHDKEIIWIIDPIDGTANFARGIPECCISVAMKHKGEIAMGVVYNPYKNELYHAVKGQGSYLNGKRLSVSERVFEDGLICTAMSLYNKQYAKICSDIIFDVYNSCNDIRRYGACAVELCYLAAGTCDLYFEYRIQPWDYSAAYLILKEAGGILTGMNGSKLNFDSPTMLIGANNRKNLERLIEIINRHIENVGQGR